MWPLVLVTFASLSARLRGAIGAIIVLTAWRAIDFHFNLTSSTPAAFWARTDIQADGLLFGVVCALVYQDRRWRPLIARVMTESWATTATLAVFILTYILYEKIDWKLDLVLLTVRAATVPAMMLSTMHRARSEGRHVLEWRVLRFVGLISYSLYLWQQLFFSWEPIAWPPMIALQTFPVNLLAVLLIATLSYAYVERPLIKLGHRLTPAHGAATRGQSNPQSESAPAEQI